MIRPKVSICIPAYKQIEYLQRTLQSIQVQNFQDYEIIITDDSPDEAVKSLVKKFNFQDKLKYFKNEKKLGSPENWNEAVRRATGEYIKIMHHDDWFISEESLGEFVKMLDENTNANFGFSATLVWQLDADVNHVHRATYEQLKILSQNPEWLFFGNFIGAPSCTIYRNTVTEKYDPRLKWLVDLDFYIQVLQNNNKFAFCTQPLVSVSDGLAHQVTQSCINNKEVELFEYTYLFKKNYNSNTTLEKYIDFFEQLFSKYSVKAYEDFDRLGIARPQPEKFFRNIIANLNYLRIKTQLKTKLSHYKFGRILIKVISLKNIFLLRKPP